MTPLADAMAWCETSIRWLQVNYPEYATHTSKLGWHDRMIRALKKIGLYDHLHDSIPELNKWIEREVKLWNKNDHDKMAKFLSEGGKAGMSKKFLGTVKLDEHTEIALELDELDELESAMTPRSEMTQEHELAEIAAQATVTADPRYKVW